MSELDPREDASGYAYAFTNTDAPAYAREAIERGDVTDEDSAEEWAHETADSMAAVIYTGQAVALYAAGITTDEDDEGLAPDGFDDDDSAVDIVNKLVTGLAYVWHRRILLDAATELLDEREDDDDDDGTDGDELGAGISLA